MVADLARRKKKGHIIRAFGTGDYFETHSPSERVKLAGANLHETSLESIEKHVKAQADDFAGRLMPIKNDVDVIAQGHHWETVKVGHVTMSSDVYIAQKLGAEYAGNGVMWLEYLINGLPFAIVAMHGHGSARTSGARINKRVAMRGITGSANWYAMAHDNSQISDPKQTLVRDGSGKLGYVKQYCTGIGSIQASYEEGTEAGYAEQLALEPACIGFVKMAVWVEQHHGRNRLKYELRV